MFCFSWSVTVRCVREKVVEPCRRYSECTLWEWKWSLRFLGCLSLTDAKFIRLAYSWHKPHSLGEHRLFMSVQDRDTKIPVSWTKSRMLLWMSLCRCSSPKKLTLFEIHTTVTTEGISVTKVHSKSPFPSLSRSFSLSFSSVVSQSNTVILRERSLDYSQAYIKLVHGLRQAVQLPPL